MKDAASDPKFTLDMLERHIPTDIAQIPTIDQTSFQTAFETVLIIPVAHTLTMRLSLLALPVAVVRTISEAEACHNLACGGKGTISQSPR